MPKVKEFCHLIIKKMERSETIILGILDHFQILAHLFYNRISYFLRMACSTLAAR